jgi:hypothetical protein
MVMTAAFAVAPVERAVHAGRGHQRYIGEVTDEMRDA